MHTSPLLDTRQDPRPSGSRSAEIRKSLRGLDREDLWRWWNAVLVIMFLTGAIVVLSLPKLLLDEDPFFQLHITLAVRGLLAVVLIFNIYTLYQQHKLKELRVDLASHMEEASQQEARAEAYYEMAILDPLTGLYNRRFSQERLEAEVSRSSRSGLPLAVIVFDLDKFKYINDRHGHAAGDVALKEFGHRLNKAIRGSDFAVRLGGDEFMVVLPECPAENVENVLSRLLPFEIDFGGNIIRVSASRGWAHYQPPETGEEIVRRADAALYEHKQATGSSARGYKYRQPNPSPAG